MKRLFLLTLLCSSPSWTWAVSGNLLNGGYAEDLQRPETLDFGDGARVGLLRTAIDIPESYGKLVSIVGAEGGSMLWFEASDGRLRNVLINPLQMVIVQRKGTIRE